MKPFRPTLLFDLDGTLVDPAKGIIASVQSAILKARKPVPPAEALHWVIGPPLRESFPRILGDEALTEDAIAAYRAAYTGGLMYEATPYPGMIEVLSALKGQGDRLFVCTSKPVAYAPKVLERFGFLPFFEKVYGPGLDGKLDDKGDLMAHLLREEALDPDRTIIIGDRLFDVRAGKQNGVRSIGVLWGYGGKEELTKAGADFICPRPADLVAMIDAAFAPAPAREGKPRPKPSALM